MSANEAALTRGGLVRFFELPSRYFCEPTSPVTIAVFPGT